jgi:uncharacterized membrane protein SirB2
MSAYYLNIKALHVACVYASIILFVIRHVLNLRGVNWRRSRALKFMPMVVDTVLLAAGISLMFITNQYPFVNSWLTVKVILLAVYIFLGILALKPSESPASRRAPFLGAAAVFAFMISVATTHSPLGVLARFFP